MLDHHHKPLGVWKVPGLPAKEVEKSEHRTTALRAITRQEQKNDGREHRPEGCR